MKYLGGLDKLKRAQGETIHMKGDLVVGFHLSTHGLDTEISCEGLHARRL